MGTRAWGGKEKMKNDHKQSFVADIKVSVRIVQRVEKGWEWMMHTFQRWQIIASTWEWVREKQTSRFPSLNTSDRDNINQVRLTANNTDRMCACVLRIIRKGLPSHERFDQVRRPFTCAFESLTGVWSRRLTQVAIYGSDERSLSLVQKISDSQAVSRCSNQGGATNVEFEHRCLWIEEVNTSCLVSFRKQWSCRRINSLHLYHTARLVCTLALYYWSSSSCPIGICRVIRHRRHRKLPIHLLFRDRFTSRTRIFHLRFIRAKLKAYSTFHQRLSQLILLRSKLEQSVAIIGIKAVTIVFQAKWSFSFTATFNFVSAMVTRTPTKIIASMSRRQELSLYSFLPTNVTHWKTLAQKRIGSLVITLYPKKSHQVRRWIGKDAVEWS